MTNEHFNLRAILAWFCLAYSSRGLCQFKYQLTGLFRLANAVSEPRRVRRQATEPLLLSADNSEARSRNGLQSEKQ
jgi:hypothetical protein